MRHDESNSWLFEQLEPSPHVIASEVGDETVLLHLDNGTYYGLDVMGTRIWNLVKAGEIPDSVCSTIAQAYGVPRAMVEDDTRKYLLDLMANGILAPTR